MVVALGPGRFYGSSLPRPRFFPGDRVDPPAPVTDPLHAWAREAHWSMGGLSSKRLRLQGRIEGSIVKLRRRLRRDARAASKARAAGQKPASLAALGSDDDGTDSDEEEVEVQERILKREVVDEEPESDESEEDNEEEALATIAAAAKKKRARKLGDEFDHIAALQHEGEAKKQKPPAASPARTSPRGKAAAVASTPAAGTPAGTSPRSKAAAASTPVAGARRTSSRNKHLLRCPVSASWRCNVTICVCPLKCWND